MVSVFDLGLGKNNELLAQEIKKYYMETKNEAEIVVHDSMDTEIMDCIGCWSCWWRTPGTCALNDGADNLYKDYINSDDGHSFSYGEWFY
jgi:multimeric flavodoxin WrbA